MGIVSRKMSNDVDSAQVSVIFQQISTSNYLDAQLLVGGTQVSRTFVKCQSTIQLYLPNEPFSCPSFIVDYLLRQSTLTTALISFFS